MATFGLGKICDEHAKDALTRLLEGSDAVMHRHGVIGFGWSVGSYGRFPVTGIGRLSAHWSVERSGQERESAAATNDRFWLKGDIQRPEIDFRFAPESGRGCRD
jgi:hypothetical protein